MKYKGQYRSHAGTTLSFKVWWPHMIIRVWTGSPTDVRNLTFLWRLDLIKDEVLSELGHSKTDKSRAHCEESNQHAHPFSLIRGFAYIIMKTWFLSYQ